MSNIERLENTKQLILKTAPDFNKLAQIHGAVHFEREASFAIQALKSNNYLAQVAYSNPDSLRAAVLNVAAVGLSLSPVHRQAYLVPRDGRVCLDVSYLGYVQLAVDCGAIKRAWAEIVCKEDQFVYNGPSQEPTHSFDPFSDRGEIIGAYCAAKTHDGEFVVTLMPISEIFSIRDRSSSWKAFKSKGVSSPWSTDESEMIKKTVIKRAYKSWTMADTRPGARERLDQAIDITNSSDPVELGAPAAVEGQPPAEDDPEIIEANLRIHKMLDQLNRKEEQFLSHLERMFSRKIKTFSDLTKIERAQAISLLKQLVDNLPKKEAGEEEPPSPPEYHGDEITEENF